MRPVALSVVEGRNFILGSFDTSGFQTWWKSLPFPGDVESIEDTTHVYGQYHVCIVKLGDGTNSIYRTHDSGKTWKEVYNTADTIYSITRIDYGHVLASTSTGWLESTLDSGLTWTKISNFAPGCKTVINISDDVLFGHDGSKIWRSYDIGHSWSRVLQKSFWFSTGYHDETLTQNFTWDSYAHPALAGAGNSVYVGFGPYLNISHDLGEHWFTHLQGWDKFFSEYKGGWGGSNLFSPFYNTRILQLEMTDISGLNSDDHVLMTRVLDLDTNQVLYAYSGANYHFEEAPEKGTGYSWQTRFSLPFADENHGIICSYNVLQPGSSEYNKLVMVCSYDASNNAVVMYSTDAGWTWTTLNHNNVSVYEGDPSQETISNLGQYVFDEEYWTKATWVGSPCHNAGKWVYEHNKTIRGLSWDLDLLAIFHKEKLYGMDWTTLTEKNKEYNVDLLCEKLHDTTINPDILLKTSTIKNMLVGGYLKTYFDKTYSIGGILAERKITDLLSDILTQKVNETFFNIRMNQKDTAQKSCEFGIKLVDDHVEEIMTSINRYTPQAPDVRYPSIPYVPFDSRDQEVT